jgi:hypothetical protein
MWFLCLHKRVVNSFFQFYYVLLFVLWMPLPTTIESIPFLSIEKNTYTFEQRIKLYLWTGFNSQLIISLWGLIVSLILGVQHDFIHHGWSRNHYSTWTWNKILLDRVFIFCVRTLMEQIVFGRKRHVSFMAGCNLSVLEFRCMIEGQV